MGTPEFPNLGQHCSVSDCNLIDFLPFTCDRCNQVYCLEHRSYIKHHCTKPNKQDVTVVLCPICAKSVRLIPDQDPNITWENHVNTDCDPSNYEKATKKKKCPAPGCREILLFSNTIKCRDCTIDHCLKHRFGPDHKCRGPRTLETGFSLMSLVSRSKKEEPRPNMTTTSTMSSRWKTSLLNVAANIRASAEASMSKISDEINQALQTTRDGMGQSSGNGNGHVEQCPQCGAKFSSVTTLVDHVQNVHERNGNRYGEKKVPIDACPKCSKGFVDPVALVEHVEREHGGTSRA